MDLRKYAGNANPRVGSAQLVEKDQAETKELDGTPLRAEFFSVGQLEQHARGLAGWHKVGRSRRGHDDVLLRRLCANQAALRDGYAFVTSAVKLGPRLSPAGEWFIDNFHLVEEHVRTARQHLPRGFSRELPKLRNGEAAGTPRVYGLALELIAHSHGRVDVDRLRSFVSAYQSVVPLRLGELWAIPIMLRLALLENLRRVVVAVTAGRRERLSASMWVHRMLEVAASDPAKVVLVLAEMVDADPPLSNAFVAEFASRLQGQSSALVFPSAWLEHRLAERGQTVEHVFRLVSQSQAADQVAIANTFGSLRLLGATDWREFVEAMSVVERALEQDPSGVYAEMDFVSRDAYRHVVETIARHCSSSEEDVARTAVRLATEESAGRAAHVGYYLVGAGRIRLERALHVRAGARGLAKRIARRARLGIYLTSVGLLTAAATAALLLRAPIDGLPVASRVAFAALLALASSQLAVAIVHWAAILLNKPRILPRLDFSKGIPPEHRTLVAVPTLLTDAETIDDLLESLEVRFLANTDGELSLALVTDFRDAGQKELPGDRELLQRVRDGIEALNRTHGTPGGRAPFFLFHRARRWNPRESVWMGWERKRGKLEELNAALRGRPDAFDTIVGDVESLANVKYVIALDGDTHLPRDSARELAGALAHPLNRPRFDERTGRVTEGYTILQPRIAITMASARSSLFARLFAGDPGIDPYTRAVSDVYQDVFDEGSFVGKGIYDVDAFIRATAGRLPENRILSHDLLEGAYARAGLVSDVLLFEDFPSAYSADVSRRSRWMRGDWQIASWLGPRVPGGDGRPTRNPISLLSRWKILDNLRRSLMPVALLALLFYGWAIHATGAAWFATQVVLAILVLPGLIAAATEFARRPSELPLHRHGREIAETLARQLARDGLTLATLPHSAFLSARAIARTAWRVLVSRRKLLEWRTAADAQQAARTSFSGSYASAWVVPFSALAAGSWIALRNPDALPIAASLLGLWMLAPALTWWLSRPSRSRLRRLGTADAAFLRSIARRTWRYFESFVVADDNHLPPDNHQEEPPQGTAHRTSPTNIGLALASNLAAYDFGFIPASELIERCSLTLRTMERMARYRSHFLNWYDTRSLQPLTPQYVSTVDSGNLAGLLLTLAAGLGQLGEHKVFRFELFVGIRDTLDVLIQLAPARDGAAEDIGRLRGSLRVVPTTLSEAHRVLRRLVNGKQEPARAALRQGGSELAWWARAFESQCQGVLDELLRMAPWVEVTPGAGSESLNEMLESLDASPSLSACAGLVRTVVPAVDRAIFEAENERAEEARRAWLVPLRDACRLAAERASERLTTLQDLEERCREFADVDYEFLYDRKRRLLAIGYNATEHRLDASFYDLLASEARLASFVAIAQGKLPQEHWFSLGRLLTKSAGKSALLSWSGSMFEYLMPLLIMPTYERTILDATYHGVVSRQIEHGREHDVPWGVSESGYFKTDAQLNYQYRAFGVPGLGFKRGLADDLVVAPYASALALMVEPEASAANLRRLAREGLLGAYGFYEAIDYTPARVPRGKDSGTVRTFMAHHEAMTLLAIAYTLLDRPMQRRFNADAAFRATDLLLQERVPRAATLHPYPAETSAPGSAAVDVTQNLRVITTPDTAAPAVQLLSNGNYHVAVTNAGGGYSRWHDLALTRWREDPTRDCWGSFCYLRDVSSGEFWSTAHQPTLRPAASYEAIFSLGRAEFRRKDGSIDTHVEISVSPEEDIELRRISLTNSGRNARSIELTSYAEVVLAPQAADLAHPAFSNLFVQTELVQEHHAILATRRPRSGEEEPPWMLHLMTVEGATLGATSYETSRAEFIGRGRDAVDPLAMHRPRLGDSEGSVLDPVVAIRRVVAIPPDETVRVHIVTGVAKTRAEAVALVEKYNDRHAADRVFELSWTHNHVLLRRLDISETESQLYDRMAGHMLFANPVLRAPRSVIARNTRGQSALWAHSISGDLPIVLLRIANHDEVVLVRQMVQAHAYWRLKGIASDLLIWNEDPSGYRQALQDDILGVVSALSESNALDRPGGIFVRRVDQLSEEDKLLMQTVARLVVRDSDGSLRDQVHRRAAAEKPAPALERGPGVPVTPVRPNEERDALEIERPDLTAFNGHGGFTHDGREYVIVTAAGSRTPAPWVNVLANPYFGSVVGESGGAYTWCENAHTYRLTPWHNDPITDASGEALYLRDEETGRFWSPTPLPAAGSGLYTTRHGFGYSVFEHEEGGIASEVQVFVATDAPLKIMLFKLRNGAGRPRRLTLTASFELVLGESRAANLPYVVTEVDPGSGALLARNAYASEFSSRVAFLDCSEESRTVSGDRREVIGRNRTPANPQCMARARLSGRVGAAFDPCLAMQVTIELAAGQEREVAFTFGSGRDHSDAITLIHRFRGTGAAHGALEQVWSHWNTTLGAVYVQTPDASLNFLANGWLLYQAIASRIWGRSGFYQSGGAFGFRDQLQDALALVHAEPGILREHILRAAAHQFSEGDVQHWWHPPLDRGVRTRISDDYLFLPFAVCRYVDAIGDTGVLDEKVGYLEGRPVEANEDSYYDLPSRSEQSGTLYEHCVRAVEHGLRFGEHGLPLMGSGDWNDGMNLVGDEGKGESVWLAFFLHDVLARFGALARKRQDATFAERCASAATRLRTHIEQHGWDGAWYRRAYFDDGEPLGSAANEECRIDSLPQSWAVLSGAADPARARQALDSLHERLVRRDLKIVLLFDPPFDRSDLKPGYVKGYPPGVRENGGQYTHAAIWAAMAFAATRDAERAWELFRFIDPVRHGDDAESIRTYRVEPYVVAADVYANPQHAGRGGWTWYTGSAAWMYRLILESLLGLRLEVDRLRIEPLFPAEWDSFTVHYRFRNTVHHVRVRNLGGGREVLRVVCDGVDQADKSIPLRSDGADHHVDVDIGGA